MILAPINPLEAPLSPAEFRAVVDILRVEARLSLSEAKAGLVRTRLARRLRRHGLDDFTSYLRLVGTDPGERAAMVTALTTSQTLFFRDKAQFDHLRDAVVPGLKARAARGEEVRLWSAGCSSGEEPYSMAMVLAGASAAEARWLDGDVGILATDLSRPVLVTAREGRYGILVADQIPLAYRAAWLSEEGDTVAVSSTLRALITFRVMNPIAPSPQHGPFDVIFCRRMMVYFDAEAQVELGHRLVGQLRPGGTLCLGPDEALSSEVARQTEACGRGIYRKR